MSQIQAIEQTIGRVADFLWPSGEPDNVRYGGGGEPSEKPPPWKLHKWLPVPRAMPKMLKELEAASQFRGQFFLARSMISGLYSK